MANYISEDDIEQALLQKLKRESLGYDIIICDSDTSKKEDLNDGTNRTDKKQCILPKILKQALIKINPGTSEEIIDKAINELKLNTEGSDLTVINYQNYCKIRDYINIDTIKNGKKDFELVKLIDFDNPQNNTFTAVSQMWIKGQYNYRRPDIILFINGLPLVFIELKNSIIKIQEAYSKNLKSYIKDIPNLFAFNQICILSNGLETKVGAYSADYDFFFEWLKASEDDKLNRESIHEEGISLKYLTESLLKKETLIDYIENFILYENKSTKILAKNHQYLGVNKLIGAFKNRRQLKGKLGVFWHTQGSGKSYSMIMFTRKVKRKIEGNFTFLIITDREDLDKQIIKNFERTGVIGNADEVEPKSAKQLRNYIKNNNKPFIFTLIQKFSIEKGKKYPILSKRDDIVVLVDEAHRTQYKTLADNMRRAIPNANYAAFTGTPLLGSKRLTNQWFGDYISEYNFAQSIEDGSTLPLYYSRRVPEVGLTNNFIDDDVIEIIEDEKLNSIESSKLQNVSSQILEVIKRDERLDEIAQDIAHHFPRRGFLGKGMVISVDKFTAVKMYDKVQHYWKEELKALTNERNTAEKQRCDELTKIINWMNDVEMAVIVSEEADEDKKFREQGLDISMHRKKMNQIINGADIEDRFKNKNDKLQLVFVCAMWLTGFDVKSLSTIYLDKPMKDHTLMQAIARANRVCPYEINGCRKTCGIIVDYVNIFKYMQQALSQYAIGDDKDQYPVKNIDKLIETLDKVIEETDQFLQTLGIYISETLKESDTNDKLDDFRKYCNIILEKEHSKNKFRVLTNLMINLYDASKPEIFERDWMNEKFSPIKYLRDLINNTVDDVKLNNAKLKMAKLLDRSVSSEKPNEWIDKSQIQSENEKYQIHESKVIDLSKIDLDGVKKEIKRSPYAAVEIEELNSYIEKALERMIDRNCERIKFSERFKSIIDRYNAGGTENEEYYDKLVQLIADLKEENSRADLMGLTEEELEIYDLLIKGKELSKKDEQKVKLAAKNLFNKLTADKKTLLVIDWYKDEQPKANVKKAIEETLNKDLPDSYNKEVFDAKTNLLLNHFIDMAVQNYGWIAEAA